MPLIEQVVEDRSGTENLVYRAIATPLTVKMTHFLVDHIRGKETQPIVQLIAINGPRHLHHSVMVVVTNRMTKVEPMDGCQQSALHERDVRAQQPRHHQHQSDLRRGSNYPIDQSRSAPRIHK